MRVAPESLERERLSASNLNRQHPHLSVVQGGQGVARGIVPKWALTTAAILFAALVISSAHLYVLVQNGLTIR